MRNSHNLTLKYLTLIFLVTIYLNVANIEINEARAASTNKLHTDKLIIQLFPEFSAYPDSKVNKPAILVSYRGILTNATDEEYSGNIEVPVPIDSPNFMIGLVAEVKNDQIQANLEYVVDNDKGLISITPIKPISINEQFEYDLQYYFTPFDETTNRDYNFIFSTNSNVEVLEVYVYPPLGSRYFELNPLGVNMLSNKLESYYYSYNNLKKGDKIEISFNYIKEDNVPTFDRLMLLSNNDNDLITKNNSTNTIFMLTLILLFALLLAILVIGSKFRFGFSELRAIIFRKNANNLKNLRKLYVNNSISEAEYYEKRAHLQKKERNNLE